MQGNVLNASLYDWFVLKKLGNESNMGKLNAIVNALGLRGFAKNL